MSSLPKKGDQLASKQRLVYCAEQGIFKHAISAQFDGFGDTYSDLINAHETLGKSSLDCGLILSINAHLWGSIFPLINYGSDEQQQQYLNNLISGKSISGYAITEPQAGSDINALEMTATITDSHIQLNGHKRFITNTPIADILIVYACLNNKLSAFIVHRDDIGADFRNAPTVSGCASATMGDLVLSNCSIPINRQLGKTGAGKMMLQQTLELERAFIFAGICGVMDWQIHQVIQFSRERRVNGPHIGKNQAVSHTIAEMKVRLDSSKLWLNECARLKDNNKRITLASAQTKLFVAEAFLQSSLDAVQLLGSHCLIKKSPIAQFVCDALASRLFSGSSEIQKNIIAALLGTGDGYK